MSEVFSYLLQVPIRFDINQIKNITYELIMIRKGFYLYEIFSPTEIKLQLQILKDLKQIIAFDVNNKISLA